MIDPIVRDHLRGFADLLEYPTPALPEALRRLQARLAEFDAAAAQELRPFAGYVAVTPTTQLEEAYTSMFDLDPKCHLYIGYHLFGDSYKRSAFLLGLKERFGASGFSVDDELPDHLSTLLRFVAMTRDETEAGEIVADALRPALDTMTGRNAPVAAAEQTDEAPAPPEAPRPGAAYLGVLESLRLVLARIAPDHSASLETAEHAHDLATADGRTGG
ncbi:MAG: molecular chaperone TorD family protein [Thermomicrobiales bacterium]|nr:molecular chaperone TorD family protein [Thermomicrobiales bacterium]